MSARRPLKPEDKPTRKKLRLSKETIRDLAAPKDKSDVVRGGKPTQYQTCECR